MTRFRLVLALAVLAACSALAGPEAQAAFPGNVGRIAFTRTEGGAQVYSISPDGSGEKKLTDAADSCCPAWSPDGTSIVFYSDRTGDDEVHVMRADGSDEHVIGANAADEGAAAWSPDGAKIAFTSDRDGDFEVWVMNANGTGAIQLTHNNGFNDYNPAWSPDGTRIAFERNPLGAGGDREIWVMTANGGNEENLTQDPAEDGEPDWAPGGSRIAFHSDRDGDWDLYSMKADGTGIEQLTDDPGSDISPAWSPDGAQIAFSSNRDGPYEIHRMELDTLAVFPVTDSGATNTSPDWQPLSPVQGDVDCTGAVNSVDALGVLRAVAQMAPPAPCLEAGDVDCSGSLTSVDALLVLRYVAGLPPPLRPAGCTDIGEPLPDQLAANAARRSSWTSN